MEQGRFLGSCLVVCISQNRRALLCLAENTLIHISSDVFSDLLEQFQDDCVTEKFGHFRSVYKRQMLHLRSNNSQRKDVTGADSPTVGLDYRSL